MKTSQKGVDLVKSFEGLRLEAYLCPAGVWTIGYGTTKNVKQGMKITQAQADQMLKDDLVRFENNVKKWSYLKPNQNEFDALVSFAYNVGSIDGLTAGGTRSKAVIAEKMLLYNKAGGKVLNGLVRRREAEQKMFLGGSASGTLTEQPVNSKNPYPVPVRTLRMNDRGDDVKWVQYQLNTKGFNLVIDGNWGSNTNKAVREFQHISRVVADGVVGQITKGKLL